MNTSYNLQSQRRVRSYSQQKEREVEATVFPILSKLLAESGVGKNLSTTTTGRRGISMSARSQQGK